MRRTDYAKRYACLGYQIWIACFLVLCGLGLLAIRLLGTDDGDIVFVLAFAATTIGGIWLFTIFSERSALRTSGLLK